MYWDQFALWDCYPKTLRFSEVQQPLKVISDFFNDGWPDEQQRDLKKWRDYVIKDEVFKDEKWGPRTLCYTYDLNIRLIEAMFLHYLSHVNSWWEAKEVTEDQLRQEKENWRFFPDGLSQEELLDPYLVIKDFFERTGLQQCRDYLHEWLHAALSTTAADESLPASEIIAVYENLLRLYSAAWLIHQREKAETNSHKSDNTKDGRQANHEQVKESLRLKEISPVLTPAELSGLEEVKKVILQRIPSVHLIVCLGKHDYPFTYYLLVLIDDNDKTPEHELSNKIEDNCRYLVNVFTIVHKAGSAIEGLNSGQRFWSKAMAKGNIVYQAPELELPQVKDISKDFLLERANFHWQRWGEQGKAFLKGAELYRVDENYRLAAFLLHQSVESLLKAIIQAVLGYRVQIHNLSRLLRMTLLFSDALRNIFELDITEGTQIYTLLQNAYTQSRYKNEFDPDKASIETLEKRVRLLFEIAGEVYQHYIKSI
ncbi:MAG TPA: HEPN domain-containing protein [Mucilaginibacter sp.]|nr:HEPN domain-containing protein [Mucilaginibacter sp.]